ncbi:SDR family oxidoreductase [Bacillus sp. 166amftsu]|uniref:SDR family oxidoreductase n=1 Tax=Bacillus sp. 166amftsu TaxID=1761753 RepID=UPI000AE18738|nr:SDR family oxidoreductase [Bacillus sp. 166amftsu]
MNIQFNFANQKALVTGGARGIGREIVKKLSQSGCKVFFTYNKSDKLAESLIKECSNYKGEIKPFHCDYSNLKSIDSLYEKLQSEGRIDFLINNAGITKDNPLFKMDTNDISSILQINLIAPIYLCKKFMRQLLVSKGSVVNVSSVSGITGAVGQTNYASSKGGLIAFSKSLAKELGRGGVRVNTVAPGYIETDMTSSFDEGEIKQLCNSISLNRFGNAEEVASIVLFLLSNESSYITGQTIVIDGGLI